MALTKNVTYIDDWSDYIDANKKIVEEVLFNTLPKHGIIFKKECNIIH